MGARAAAGAALFLLLLAPATGVAQVEHVPAGNQVYEFLDRLGVRGVVPLATAASIPLSRAEVLEALTAAGARRSDLSGAERAFLEKFLREFSAEPLHGREHAAGLLNGAAPGDLLSDREKYLYMHADSAATLYVEFLGSLEHRRRSGGGAPGADASFETHGFRARGTVRGRLGYFAQVTNGTLYGDRAFALSDPRLRANVKFNELNSPYFDVAEAYLRADLSWFHLGFGREFLRLGTGYSDRLVLSDNAPAMDMLRLDARYGAVRYTFLHGAVLLEPAWFAGLPAGDPARQVNKYVAVHRVGVSLAGVLNAAFSEAAVYHRTAMEFAYLNPLLFLKSAEHSLRDRDNTMMAFDLELFPAAGWKFFGALLVDDVDFARLGTGWWGNQFAWQGGVYLAGPAGVRDVDLHAEYTRIEPYVYSNRITGNAFTNGEAVLGHRLEPNSDEWLLRVLVRPSARLRGWVGVRRIRHGANVEENGSVTFNAGGDVLVGHRGGDPDVAPFLAGRLVETRALEARAWWEPVTNLVLSGSWDLRRTSDASGATTTRVLAVRGALEF